MYYAVTEHNSKGNLHVFEDRDERNEFTREHDAFVCTSKDARRFLEHEVLMRDFTIPTSEVREMIMDDLVSALIECDHHCRIQDNGLIELSRVTVHWDV